MAGQGKGPRIVKPRSTAQQAQARYYNDTHVAAPVDAGLPEASWWANPRSREGFSATAAAEQGRMKESKFGSHRGTGIRDQG